MPNPHAFAKSPIRRFTTLMLAPYDKPSVLDFRAIESKTARSAAEKEVIKIQPASKLKWSNVIMVADTCRKAGFKNVSFVEPPGFNISVVN